MDQFISKQLKKVSRQEHKLMKEKRESWISYRTRPAREKIEDSIPEKLKETLEIAFYKGFKLVFEKGAPIIDKTYNK